jgi:hypothetical protein
MPKILPGIGMRLVGGGGGGRLTSLPPESDALARIGALRNIQDT